MKNSGGQDAAFKESSPNMSNLQLLHEKHELTHSAVSAIHSGGVSTHHSVGKGVAGLGHRQTLDDLWSHPGKRAHQRHVRGVGQEPGRSEITDLKKS